MKLVLEDPLKAEIFVNCFQYFRNFTENVNIMFQEERMYVQSMDSGMVLVLELSLPKDFFDVYELTNEYSVTIGVNTSTWSKVLSMHEKNQVIKINTEEKDDFLSLSFCSENAPENVIRSTTSKNKNQFDKDFEIPLLDIQSELLEIPEIDYQVEINMLSSIFSGMINQIKQFGDSLDISCDEDNVIFSSYKEESGKMDAKFSAFDFEEYAIDENTNIEMSYGLRYFYNISQYQKISKDLTIYLKEDNPVKIKYLLEESVTKNNGYLQFYIAPKISDLDE